MSSGGGNSGKESRKKSAKQQEQRDALANSSCFSTRSTASWTSLWFTTAEARTGEDEEEVPSHIAHFSIDEIQKDTCCYSFGKYSESFLIRGINQTHRASDPLHQSSRDWLTSRLFFGRSSTISTTTTGDCKFVIKHIRPEFMHSGSQEEFEKAASYLANEASMLQTLRQHSGIATLLGTSIDSTEAYYTHGGRPDAFFIIHERVIESLEQRILKWKDKLARIKAFQVVGGIFSNSTRSEEQFMATRLGVAYEIADALAYMHRNSVAYRNFGMDKVGFNRSKKMQLIDLGDADKLLGLARVQEYGENQSSTATALQESLGLHRGKESSFRGSSSISSSQQIIAPCSMNASSYTAPEMMVSPGGDEGKFSEKSVSFSFTKLVSELLTLIVVGWHPSKKVTVAYINEFQRISSLLSKDLLQQLHQGISVNPHIRPTMERFVEAINLGIRAIAGKNKEQLQRSSSDHSFASSSRSSAPRRRVTWHDHGSLLRSSKSPASLPAGNLNTQDDPPPAGR